MLDAAPLAYPCQESIDPPWQLCHFHGLVLFTFACPFRPEAQWPANTKTSTPIVYETCHRILLLLLAGIAISANLQSRYNDPKRQSLSTCCLSFSLKKTLPTRPGSSATP